MQAALKFSWEAHAYPDRATGECTTTAPYPDALRNLDKGNEVQWATSNPRGPTEPESQRNDRGFYRTWDPREKSGLYWWPDLAGSYLVCSHFAVVEEALKASRVLNELGTYLPEVD